MTRETAMDSLPIKCKHQMNVKSRHRKKCHMTMTFSQQRRANALKRTTKARLKIDPIIRYIHVL